MVQVTQAIAEVASYVPPPKALTPGKGPKDWKQYLEDMKKGSKELGEALKAAEPAKVKTSANNLNSACNNCHTDFR
jgi:cytochrome c556